MVKFDNEQTEQILLREEQKQTLVRLYLRGLRAFLASPFFPSFIPIIREVKTQFLQTISIFMHVESGCILMEIIFSIAVVSTNGETCEFLDKLFLLASK